MGEDIPSYKEVIKKKRPPRLFGDLPEGVSIEKKFVFKGYGYFFLVIFLVSLFVFGYASSLKPGVKYVVDGVHDKSWELKPGYYNRHTWRVDPEDVLLVINATVTGGNNDLDVYIDTPSGRINYGRLTSPIRIKLNLTRYGPGDYTIYLDNSFSLVTSKYITLHERLYKAVPDTSEKEGYYLLAFILAFVGGIGVIGALRRKVIVKVDDDIVELMLGAGFRHPLYLTVNGFKLDQKVTGPLKFRIGKDESRVFAVEPIDWFRNRWAIFVDDKQIGTVP